MKLVYPDFYPKFHCLAGACPDSCCRQGWQIPVDEAHVRMYGALPGKSGEAVRRILTHSDGETVLAMKDGVCPLLREDGLCALAAEHGEDSLCHICHTHPRFLEEYGGTREIHLSLSCPEAARLSLMGRKKLTFASHCTEEEVTEPNTIDPDEYFALLTLRDFSIRLAQHRGLPVADRMALLLQLAQQAQSLFDRKRYDLCKQLCRSYRHLTGRRQLKRLRRQRLRGTGWFAEAALFHRLEHLGTEFPELIRLGLFTARDGTDFDRQCGIVQEHLLVLWLSHYLPKAVGDGRVDTKLRFAVLMTLTVQRLCVCQGRVSPADAARVAGILAKEIEHSPENLRAVWAALEAPGWHTQLLLQLPRE